MSMSAISSARIVALSGIVIVVLKHREFTLNVLSHLP
jgi:hypothetical protein